MKEHLRWLVPVLGFIGIIALFVSAAVCYGETTDELLNRANKVRVVNDTTVTKAYFLENVKEPKVWVCIVQLEPLDIFHTRLIPGRYKFALYDLVDGSLQPIHAGYFSLSEKDLENGYTIFLSLYPFDNQGRDWEGWR